MSDPLVSVPARRVFLDRKVLLEGVFVQLKAGVPIRDTIDLEPGLYELAPRSIDLNGLSGRWFVFRGDKVAALAVIIEDIEIAQESKGEARFFRDGAPGKIERLTDAEVRERVARHQAEAGAAIAEAERVEGDDAKSVAYLRACEAQLKLCGYLPMELPEGMVARIGAVKATWESGADTRPLGDLFALESMAPEHFQAIVKEVINP